jgi:hypothetical protein
MRQSVLALELGFFTAFGDVDGSDIMAIAWAAGPKTGPFQLELDNIRLQ